MGYGVFRRPPYVGKPKRKVLPPQLFPRSAFDNPQPKARKANWPLFRRKPRRPKVKPLLPQITLVSSPSLHVKRPLWNIYRRRLPPIYRKPRLRAALFTTTRFDAPPLRKPKLSWRLFRKPPFRKLARKVLNLALFLIAPVVGTRIVEWSASPRWNAKTNRAQRVAALFFAPPKAAPAVDTHDGALPRREVPSRAAQYADSVLRKIAADREEKRRARDVATEQLRALVEGRPLPADDRAGKLAAEIAALNTAIAKLEKRQREEEQIILLVLGLYDD